MRHLQGATIVVCCWPFKVVLEYAISSDSDRCRKSQNRQGYIALVFFRILSLFKGAHKSGVQGLLEAIIVIDCWPFKVVLECAISSDSDRY